MTTATARGTKRRRRFDIAATGEHLDERYQAATRFGDC
jgi:hypothetical protein